MSPRLWAIALTVIFGAALVWRHRESAWVREWWQPQPQARVKIEFDNGTVRQYGSASGAAATAAPAPLAPGSVRKCIKGTQVAYTGAPCESGWREASLGGIVNVVPPAPGVAARAAAGPGATPAAPASPGRAPRSVYDVMERDGTVRQRMVERAAGSDATAPNQEHAR